MKTENYENKIANAKSLGELATALREYREFAYNQNDENYDMNFQDYQNYDMSDLPVFSVKAMPDTNGIYSYDDTHYIDSDWNICERDDI